MIRIGHGYDVHKFTSGRPLILGGVKIPYEYGLYGHSDADVVLHAVCDALLGAAAMRDIGYHFPDNKDDYKNIDSRILLKKTFSMLEKEGFSVVNIDVTVIAQEPKLSPYIENMVKNISQDLSVGINQVNVKATTEEGLGFTGKKEGIAVHSVCLIEK